MQQTASTHSAALAHSHSSQDGHVAANPTILLNNDVPAQSRTSTAHPPPRIDGIGSTNKFHIWAEDAPSSNCDGAIVRYAAVSTNKHVITNSDVVPVVTMKRRLDNDALATTAKRHFHLRPWDFTIGKWRLRRWSQGEDLAEKAAALFGAGAMRWVGRIVEAPDGSDTFLAVFGQSGSQWVVVETLEHLLTLGVLIVTSA